MDLHGMMEQPAGPKPGSSLMERYESLVGTRSPYLDRARDYADFTLNWLLPETATPSGESNQHGWQSLGAQLVRHLANKITQTLFPTQQPFFAFAFTEQMKEDLEEQGFKPDELGQALIKLRNKAMEDHHKTVPRIELIKAMINLIITGNGLLYRPTKDGKFNMVPMDRYVIRRDASGNLLELVTVQMRHLYTFSREEQEQIKKSPKFKQLKDSMQIPLYTSQTLEQDGKYRIKQEALESPVGRQYLTAPEDSPFLPLVWMLNYGEHWGRGLVEEHAGDLYVYGFLMESLAKGMALMADVKYLVKPGSAIDVDHAITSPTGEWLTGNIEDVGILQLERYADFTPIANVADEYKRRLGQAFLLASAVRRDAERVTTYELRLDANELENSLGGMYSHMSDSLQKPLAQMHMQAALDSAAADLSRMIKEGTRPVILTGTEALGKASELDKIVQFGEIMQLPNTWPEEVREQVNFGTYTAKVSNLLHMDGSWLLTAKQVAENRARKQQAAMAQQAAAEASKAAPQLLTEQTQE